MSRNSSKQTASKKMGTSVTEPKGSDCSLIHALSPVVEWWWLWGVEKKDKESKKTMFRTSHYWEKIERTTT